MLTAGGVRSGYRATGSVGIAISPPRMMSSEQTVARIGRRMNSSENMSVLPSLAGPGARGCRCASRRKLHDRRAVADLLQSADDQLLAGLEARDHDVVIADDLPEHDRTLMRDEPL